MISGVQTLSHPYQPDLGRGELETEFNYHVYVIKLLGTEPWVSFPAANVLEVLSYVYVSES